MKILVSACLLGIGCRYDGGNKVQKKWVEALKNHEWVPVCPEQLGGLTTPRPPSEIVSETPVRVQANTGADVTGAFTKGAAESLALATLLGATCAVLKEGSPSCGVNRIYDGTFKNLKVPGQGLTARVLKEAGLTLYSEEELERFLKDTAAPAFI